MAAGSVFPSEIPVADLARICGLSAPTLSRLVADGKITRGERYGFYPPQAISEYIAYLIDRVNAKPSEEQKPDKAYRHYRAVRARLEAEEMAGELVRVDRVEHALMLRVSRAVAQLNSLPDAVCAALSELLPPGNDTAIAEARAVMVARVNQSCLQLAEMDEEDLEGISPEVEPFVDRGEDESDEEN